MKNSFGKSVIVTLWGESHGDEIGAVLDGIAPGIPIPYEYIEEQLQKRHPKDELSTPRQEQDAYRFASGVKDGYTTGAPLTVILTQQAFSREEDATRPTLARPGHADLAACGKYHGFEDHAGGGHFSGRLTAPLVILGSILRFALLNKGIRMGTHILELGQVHDRPFALNPCFDFEYLKEQSFPTLDPKKGVLMKQEILRVKEEGDSLGGILETAIMGIPCGIGEPWFTSLESVISSTMFAIPGIKGVLFGAGMDFAKMKGSEANDIPLDFEEYETNHNGGISAGISTGMPIVFQTIVRPTPTIAKLQETIDYTTGESAVIFSKTPSDPAFIRRMAPIVDSMMAIVLSDELALRYGTDWITGDEADRITNL